MIKNIAIFVLIFCSIAYATPKNWIEKHTNIEFIWVPSGCFIKGCLPKDKDCYFDEKPPRKVCVKGFWISKHEITVKQWRKFVQETSYKPAKKELWGCVDTAKPQFKQTEDDPVVCINWYDAKAFANWLSKISGIKIRLPKEIEWEYACKGAQNRLFSCGDDIDGNKANFWSGFGGKWGKDKFKFTAPVCFFSPNPLGVCDLSGNVWEWMEDWYSIPNIPSLKNKKVIKGGGWESQKKFLRCSARKSILPERNYDTVGFRLIAIK